MLTQKTVHNVDVAEKQRNVLLYVGVYKNIPIHFYNPHLLWQDECCSIVFSNSFLSQRNPSLTEAMSVLVFLCVSDGVCVSVRGPAGCENV